LRYSFCYSACEMDEQPTSDLVNLVLDVVEDGVFTVDRERRITSLNRAAEKITGYKQEAILGRLCWDVFRTELCKTVCPLKKSIDTRERVRHREVYIHTADDRAIPISVSTAPLVTPTGELLGGVETFRDLSPQTTLAGQGAGRYRLGGLVGASPAMRDLFDLLPRVAASDSTLLIHGPSGAGKELVARTVHELGARRAKPFVSIKCAGVPDTYLESNLFGCGPWVSGEEDSLPGGFARAEGGTLFLDEVGALPLITQVKLLNILESRTYEPVGSKREMHTDVRIIAGTARDLEAMVAEGTFREDLLFRLRVLPIELPPLRERREDIPLLTRHFIHRFAASTGNPIEGIDAEAMNVLLGHDFLGNVRELEIMVERAFILCREPEIGLKHLPPLRTREGSPRAMAAPSPPEPDGTHGLDEVERQTIRSALARHDGNRTRAARELGIHRTTLLRKMRRYGLR